MGLSVNMWCVENFNTISKLWGKMILIDDRAKESKSYSIARVLIDSFQWEAINKWISIKIEDITFDVFFKETGAEAYSVELHPDLGDTVSEMVEDTKSQAELEKSPTTDTCGNLKSKNIIDPIIDEEINGWWNNVPQFNDGRESCGGGWGYHVGEFLDVGVSSLLILEEDLGLNDLGFDLALYEAQIVCRRLAEEKRMEDENKIRMGCEDNEPVRVYGENSDGSCPFPPGFRPCVDQYHVHRVMGRAHSSPNLDIRIPNSGEESESSVDAVGVYSENSRAVYGKAGLEDDEDDSDETRYMLNIEAIKGGAFGSVDNEDGGVVVTSALKGGDANCVALVPDLGVTNNDDVCSTGLLFDNRDEDVVLSEQSTELGLEIDERDVELDSIGESVEEDSSADFCAAKETRCRAGLFFDSSEDEEIRSKLSRNKRLDGKKRSDLRPKDQSQGKKLPCILGEIQSQRERRSYGVEEGIEEQVSSATTFWYSGRRGARSEGERLLVMVEGKGRACW
ncbi:hypothetical protein PIB30_004461 [Stylosanthes scabra]|uniref:DUF4283 domain-containing protein n=1 Tax=Stylosanthes scabra TaxID=79078 RepID=A0ABU6W4Y4_9FABA|nr:hypothetical protein [Stylosanthes scabra]